MHLTFPLPLLPSPIATQTAPTNLRSFLLAHPPAAYTSLLTTRKTRAVPQLHHHAARLANGAAALSTLADPPAALQPPRLAAAFAAAVQALQNSASDAAPLGPHAEAMLVAVVSADAGAGTSAAPELHVFAQWRTSSATTAVEVEARGRPREAPAVKNTGWVSARRGLEDARAEGAAETVLLGEGSAGGAVLLEGLVTNFFVVRRDGVVCTAPEGEVLGGSVRALVLRAARAAGVAVEERAPAVEERGDFDAAFITNAVQILTPVKRVRLPTLALAPVELPWTPRAQAVVDLLQADVWRELEKGSTSMETM